MAFPKVVVDKKEVILLSGFKQQQNRIATGPKATEIVGIDLLAESVKRHPDAVAFGYMDGKWVPGV